jgi:hypothetical protein
MSNQNITHNLFKSSSLKSKQILLRSIKNLFRDSNLKEIWDLKIMQRPSDLNQSKVNLINNNILFKIKVALKGILSERIVNLFKKGHLCNKTIILSKEL